MMRMKIKTGLTLLLVAAVSGPVVMPQVAKAQWIQIPLGVPRAPGCDVGYSWQKIGVRYQCATPQPTCAYGFASGPNWNGSAWIYSCNVPPAPTCQYGYASGPAWNGNAWIYACASPPVTPPPQLGNPTETAKANCAARALQDGITLGPLTRRLQYASRGYSQWYYDESVGTKYWTKADGYTQSNVYEVVCTTMDDTGAWASVGGAGNYAVFENQECMIGGGGCGG